MYVLANPWTAAYQPEHEMAELLLEWVVKVLRSLPRLAMVHSPTLTSGITRKGGVRFG